MKRYLAGFTAFALAACATSDDLDEPAELAGTSTSELATCVVTPLHFGDFDGDGRNDVLLEGDEGQLAIWQMNGVDLVEGEFLPALPPSYSFRDVGDFDGDGKSDVLMKLSDGRGAVWVMDGTTVVETVLLPKSDQWSHAGVGDLNGDGQDDIVFERDDGRRAVWYLHGNAPVTGEELPRTGVGWHVVVIADFGGDGRDDLLLEAEDGRRAIWEMNGSLIATAEYLPDTPAEWSIAGASDFDGDGRSDLVFARELEPGAIWFMQGSNIVDSAYLPNTSEWQLAVAGDLDADARADLFLSEPGGAGAIWLMDGAEIKEGGFLPNVGPGWYACRPEVDEPWSRGFGSNSFGQLGSLALDGDDNNLLVGTFRVSINFGGGNLTGPGDNDVYVAKLTPEGNHLWSKAFGASGIQNGFGVAADADGNVYIGGQFRNAINFGGGLLTAQDRDGFVAKLDASGTHVWSKRLGSSGFTDEDSVVDIAVDPNGDLVVLGTFGNTVDFGGGPLASAGFADVFLVKLDSAGNHMWSKRFGGGGNDTATNLAVSSSGSIAIVASSGGTSFGGGTLPYYGSRDAVVAVYDTFGNHIWSNAFGGPLQDTVQNIDFGPAEEVTITGYFESTIDFGGGTLTSAGGDDAFVARLDPTGSHIWSRRFGDSAEQRGVGITVDDVGNAIVVGSFAGSADFGGGMLTSAGLTDIFIAKYNPQGAWMTSARFGFVNEQAARSAAVDTTGSLIVAGTFSPGILDFGQGWLPGGSGTSVFLAQPTL